MEPGASSTRSARVDPKDVDLHNTDSESSELSASTAREDLPLVASDPDKRQQDEEERRRRKAEKKKRREARE